MHLQRANITKFVGNLDMPSDDSSIDLGFSDSDADAIVSHSKPPNDDTKSQILGSACGVGARVVCVVGSS